MRVKTIRLLPALILALFVTCTEEEATRGYPSVDTGTVSENDATGITLHGEIVAVGDAGIADHGFVYDHNENPSINNSERISLGEASGKGAFSARATNSLSKGAKYFVRAYAIAKTTATVVYGQKFTFTSATTTPFSIRSFPREAVVGDSLTITGSGLSTVQQFATVLVDDRAAPVTKQSPTAITFVVPSWTKTKGSKLAVKIDAQVAVSPDLLTLKPMRMTSFSPAEASFGETITVNGENFPITPYLATATLFGSQPAIVVTNRTQLVLRVPTDAKVAESLITITAGDQTLTSSETVRLKKPVLTDFAPLVATANTQVVIQGANFNTAPVNNQVMINGVALKVQSASTTRLTVIIPAGIPPGSYPITVTVVGQTTSTTSSIEIE